MSIGINPSYGYTYYPYYGNKSKDSVHEAAFVLEGEEKQLEGQIQKDMFSTDKQKIDPLTGEEECETCKNRKYVDGSDDASVSFQTPTHVDPSASASAVISHESQHVSHEQAFAARDDREILSQSVSIKTAICPECGKAYVSGGETRTVSRSKIQKAYNVGNEALNLINMSI